MSQMKEQGKNLQEQINEEEIGNLPEKEFRVMIVKMIQNLRNRMEAQIEKITDEEQNKEKRMKRIENISSMIRNKIRVPTLTTIIQHSFGSTSYGNQRRKKNKRNTNWKRRSKTVTVCR